MQQHARRCKLAAAPSMERWVPSRPAQREILAAEFCSWTGVVLVRERARREHRAPAAGGRRSPLLGRFCHTELTERARGAAAGDTERTRRDNMRWRRLVVEGALAQQMCGLPITVSLLDADVPHLKTPTYGIQL